METIMDRVRAAASNVSPSLMRVGQWIVERPVETLSMSAEEIVSRTGASVAAINRFSKAAGFDGFADLKVQLGRELQSAMEPIAKLRNPAADGDVSRDAADRVLAASRAPQIAQAAVRAIRARHVWFLGLGASSYLARYAEHSLMPFLDSASSASGDGGTEELARRLSRCGKGDVLIALSLPRFSKDTVTLASFARGRGAYVIVITDQANSALTEIANLTLSVPTEHAVLPGSAVGMLAVLESLVSRVMKLNPNAVEYARELADSVLSHLS
jgi:DNA-binding MurR/RpiR family transcriptional regulator